MQCRFVRAGQRCQRAALSGWTTCNAHHTAGMNTRQWRRIQAAEKPKPDPPDPFDVQADWDESHA